MNRTILFLLCFIILALISGCVVFSEGKDSVPRTWIDGVEYRSIYPFIYADRIEVVFPNNEGTYRTKETYMKFRDGNITCYTYLGSSAAGNSISCVKE